MISSTVPLQKHLLTISSLGAQKGKRKEITKRNQDIIGWSINGSCSSQQKQLSGKSELFIAVYGLNCTQTWTLAIIYYGPENRNKKVIKAKFKQFLFSS
jgi:hypothetical protein